MNTEKTSKSSSNIVWGLILMGLGIFLLLDNLDIFDVLNWWHYWPIVMVIFGMNKMIDFDSAKEFANGVWLVVVGLWLYACFEHIWGMTFGNSWPVFLIACGASEVLKAVLQRNGEQHHGK